MTMSLHLMLQDYVSSTVFNPWAQQDKLDYSEHAARDRRYRLDMHFDTPALYLLIGEAPGYQGCHFSGIPFTNEALILKKRIPRVLPVRITRRRRPWSEPSATIVWKALRELGIDHQTVMWNAFPWHPHKKTPLSNRKPTPIELEAGRSLLDYVLDRYANAKVIAVGKVAEGALSKIPKLKFHSIRHPSMGGARMFREQLTAVVKGARDDTSSTKRSGTVQPGGEPADELPTVP